MQMHEGEFVKKVIKWDKWKSPYDKKIKGKEEDDLDLDDEEELKYATNLMITPLGAIPINGSESVFNFWVGHTNFNISKNIAAIIKKVPGVEVLQIYTRYRFRVGIAEMFLENAVKKRIDQGILNYFQQREAHDGKLDPTTS